MKKILLATILCSLISFNSAEAKTTFLPRAGNSIGTGNRVSSNANNAARCYALGYIFSKTSECGELLDTCPQSSDYYRSCCPIGYKYTLEQCNAMGKVPVASETRNCPYYTCK